MVRFIRSFSVEIVTVLLMCFLLYFLLSGYTWLDFFFEWTKNFQIEDGQWQNISTIFLSIFVEGLPFILIGVFVSSFIHVFVKEETIYKWIPKNPLLSLPFAVSLGLLFPICECGIVPVVKRLIQKGVPAYVAITFLLAAPVINPVTIISTYVAFGGRWEMVGIRVLFAAGIAILLGLLFMILYGKMTTTKILKNKDEAKSCNETCCNHSHHHHEEPHTLEKVTHGLYHSVFEFIDTGKYFVLGALIASFFQVFIGLTAMREFAGSKPLAVLLVMGLAFGISVCSSSDAFIAASFRTVLGTAPIAAFLVFGPMMDLKNLLMMFGSFRRSVIVFLFAGTVILTFASVLLFF